MKLIISITKEVLEATAMCGLTKGTDFTTHCAVSHAVREIWPKVETVDDEIYPFGPCHTATIKHSEYKFIWDFDSATPAERAAMKPFSFEIEVPDEVIGEVNIEEIMDIIKNSKTLELL